LAVASVDIANHETAPVSNEAFPGSAGLLENSQARMPLRRGLKPGLRVDTVNLIELPSIVAVSPLENSPHETNLAMKFRRFERGPD